MSILKVDLAALQNYSKSLSEKQQKIASIRAELTSTLESISGSWGGTDAETFITNSTAYIENLKVIEDAMLNFSNKVGEKTSKYAQAIEAYYG